MNDIPLSKLRLSGGVAAKLRCPCCRAPLSDRSVELVCCGCGRAYPVADGVPVLLDDETSLFTVADVLNGAATFFPPSSHPVKRALRRAVPSLNWNYVAKENYRVLAEHLTTESSRPCVLVVGGSVRGAGIESLAACSGVEIVETDITIGATTAAVCDAHSIPFADGSFDAVIAQAVLEHVIDPYRCVEEFYRVLRPAGLVYAETPFMQQVHAGAYDFTRFTHLGHRRLFRRFEELHSGAACGPGMALAWAYQYFCLSFTRRKRWRGLVNAATALTAFWLRYADRIVLNSPAALDAASGYYFMGRKSERVLSDRDLVRMYRGGHSGLK